MNTRSIMNEFAERVYQIAEYVNNLPGRRCGVEFGSETRPRRGMLAIEDGDLVFYEGILLLLDSKVDLRPAFADRKARMELVCSYMEVEDLYKQVCEAQSSEVELESHLRMYDKYNNEMCHYSKPVTSEEEAGWELALEMKPGWTATVTIERKLDSIHLAWRNMISQQES